MTRAAQLLLLLLASWLLAAAPSGRLPRAGSTAPSALASEERARASVQHAVAELGTVQVPRAPLVARVPAPLPSVGRERLARDVTSAAPPDLREALRRVQTRRRLPRLPPQEPPWC